MDIPEDVDITTTDSGSKTRFPDPPKGTRIRWLTSTPASGIVRGSHDGTRAGYYATAPDGSRQVFIINSQGSDQDTDPAMRPIQAWFLAAGAAGGLRWHPSGNSIAVLSDNGVVAVCVRPGPLFGAAWWLTPHGPQLASTSIETLVWSRDGRMLAYNRRVPTYDSTGKYVKDIYNSDFRQIFLTNFPDVNGNWIADPIEAGVVRNAASFQPGRIAPDSWASFFGSELAPSLTVATTTPLPISIGNVSVEVTDSAGTTRPAMLQFVAPQQINFLVPTGTKPGDAMVKVITPIFHTASAPVVIGAVAPGIFSANSSGAGVAAAVAVKIDAAGKQTSQMVFQCTGGAGTCTATPIDLGAASDQAILFLYGTGIRGYTTGVKATIGGQTADVAGVAAQGQYAGLDQINVRVPKSLAGKGDAPIVVTVDGRPANTVSVNIK